MSALSARRLGRAAAVTAVAACLPTLAVTPAAAATAFAPDFAGSTFAFSGATSTFAAVEATAGHVIALPSTIGVKFTAPVKTQQLGNGLTVGETDAAAPYFLDPSTNQQVAGTSSLDAADDTVLDVTPPADLPDGTYQLHVTAFDADACPDAQSTDLLRPQCTTYDGLVDDDAASPAPFTFTVDRSGPAVAIATIEGATLPLAAGAHIDADHVGNVVLTGTADPDTASMSLKVSSAGGGPTRLIPVTLTAHAGQPSTWSASDDLGALADGVLTFSAKGKDAVGNSTATPATATVPLAAHPGAPRSVHARAADSGAVLRWSAPAALTPGHPVTGYAFTATDRATHQQAFGRVSCAGGRCPTTGRIKGLTNGHRYTVAVAAVTDVGGHGAAATAGVLPKAATRLTILAQPHAVAAGRKVTLTGRLSTVRTGTALRRVRLAVLEIVGGRARGATFTVRTDSFGVWSKTVRPTRTTTYRIHWTGDPATLAATAHRRVVVR